MSKRVNITRLLDQRQRLAAPAPTRPRQDPALTPITRRTYAVETRTIRRANES